MIKVNGQMVHTIELGGFNELRFCRDGLFLYNKNDAYVGNSLKIYGEYCRQEALMLEHLIWGDSVVVEVGANIGSHTVGIAKRAKEVYAVEPQRMMFQLLCANLALNQCKNVWARQEGMGSVREVRWVPYRDPAVAANFGGVALAGVIKDARDEPLHITRLDDYVWSPTLLKIDVEGMETEVIMGGVSTITRCRPTIYCENDRREKSSQLCDTLRGLGYTLYWHLPPLFNPANFANEKTNVFGNTVSVNMLCRPNPRDDSFGLAPVNDPEEFWQH